MASFNNILTDSNELKGIDCTIKNLTITGDLIIAPPSEPPVETVEIDLFDSFNDAPVGNADVYFYKVGQMCMMSVQSFILTSPLADASSFLYTDYELPLKYTPYNSLTTANDQLFGFFPYSYPLAPGAPIGRFGISQYDTANPTIRFYGDQGNGGFNTLTTITAFNCTLSYITQ